MFIQSGKLPSEEELQCVKGRAIMKTTCSCPQKCSCQAFATKQKCSCQAFATKPCMPRFKPFEKGVP